MLTAPHLFQADRRDASLEMSRNFNEASPMLHMLLTLKPLELLTIDMCFKRKLTFSKWATVRCQIPIASYTMLVTFIKPKFSCAILQNETTPASEDGSFHLLCSMGLNPDVFFVCKKGTVV